MSDKRFILCEVLGVTATDLGVDVVVKRQLGDGMTLPPRTILIPIDDIDGVEDDATVPIDLTLLSRTDASELLAGRHITLSWGIEDAYSNVVTESARALLVEIA